MNIHELKTRESFFLAICNRSKNFEIRNNDRGFKVNDLLVLREWTGTQYTGNVITAKVIYITDFEQKPGFVVMAIDVIDAQIIDE
jgi:hypothetical protein